MAVHFVRPTSNSSFPPTAPQTATSHEVPKLESLDLSFDPKLHSSVSIVTSYRVDDHGTGVRFPAQKEIFSSAKRPESVRSPTSFLLSNGKVVGENEALSHLHLEAELRNHET